MYKQIFVETYDHSTAEGSVYGGSFVEKHYFLGIKYMEKSVNRTIAQDIRDKYPLTGASRMGFNRQG